LKKEIKRQHVIGVIRNPRESSIMANTQEARKEIANILGRLIAEYAPQRVILFGSYAYGNPQSDSDIDLLIIKDTSDRFIDRWVTVRRILSDAKRSLPLDTLILTPREVAQRLAIGDQFIAEVLERGEVLYAA
jgi:predicted nucleotidyltransferase